MFKDPLSNFILGAYLAGRSKSSDFTRAGTNASTNPGTAGPDGGEGFGMLLPIIEAFVVGFWTYQYVSGSIVGPFGKGLHWDWEAGIFLAIISAILWMSLFTIPLIGSILNSLISALWCAIAWMLFKSVGWAIVIFFISLAMHAFIVDFDAQSKRWRLEKLTLVSSTLCVIVLWVRESVSILHAQGQTITTDAFFSDAFTVPAVILVVALVLQRIAKAVCNPEKTIISYINFICFMTMIVSGYMVFKWTSSTYLTRLAYAFEAKHASPSRGQRVNATSSRTVNKRYSGETNKKIFEGRANGLAPKVTLGDSPYATEGKR